RRRHAALGRAAAHPPVRTGPRRGRPAPRGGPRRRRRPLRRGHRLRRRLAPRADGGGALVAAAALGARPLVDRERRPVRGRGGIPGVIPDGRPVRAGHEAGVAELPPGTPLRPPSPERSGERAWVAANASAVAAARRRLDGWIR